MPTLIAAAFNDTCVSEWFIKHKSLSDKQHSAVQCSACLVKNSQLMLYREIMAVCSEIHTKHINTVCGQNVELLDVKLVVHIVTTVWYI